jgi:hypothetical protein
MVKFLARNASHFRLMKINNLFDELEVRPDQ